MSLPPGFQIDPAELPPGFQLDSAAAKKKAQAPQTRLEKFGSSLGTGIGEAALDVYQPLRHPYDTAAGLVKTIGGTQPLAEEARARLAQPDLLSKLKGAGMAVASDFPLVGPAIVNAAKETAEDPVAGLTHAALNLATLKAVPELARETARVGGAVREAAMEEPKPASLRAQYVNPESKLAKKTLLQTETARPYLSGAKTQSELQQRLPSAKEEVWGPYKAAVERAGDRAVDGPDGPTTVRELEAERKRLSAINRPRNAADAFERQRVLQAGQKPADLLRREAAVQRALDPALRDEGIDPRATRRVYSALRGVEERVAGRESGLARTPVGFGRMLQGARVGEVAGKSGGGGGLGEFATLYPRSIIGGVRDITAGRGLWSASPADIATREGFRIPAEKPTLTVAPPPRRLALPPGTTIFGRAGEIGGPSFVRGVEAERTLARGKGGRFVRVYTSNPRVLKRP